MRGLRLWVAGALFLGSVSAYARDDASAARHLAAGSKLFQDGNYAGALSEFEAGRKLKPLPALDYGIARSLDLLGRHADAIPVYQRYLYEADAGSATLTEVRQRLDELEAEEAAPAAVKSAVSGPAPDSPITPVDAYHPPRTVLGRVGFGLLASGAAIGLAGSLGFGMAAQGASDTIVAESRTHLPFDPSVERSGVLYQNLAIAAAITGGALALTGAILSILDARLPAPAAKAASLQFSPIVGHQLTGAALEGRF
jgi:hypothetical protein